MVFEALTKAIVGGCVGLVVDIVVARLSMEEMAATSQIINSAK